ncbi:MAG: chemoreceptor glutamine deamidase CheD [Zoogloeaceae bacterium]|nr:chemoreceptor glutamine deamidase CheD [Rhodocyclaceae bacterium]MCP5234383.1 chemoreceptor glutamine deamidase CheD [Zoogloeaceae bacterium]
MPAAHEPAFSEHLATNRYFDRTFSRDAVKVLPGEYFVATTDLVMVTVLGSCVSACIRDREKGIGGMNHFMLPEGGNAGLNSSSARYGAYAMEVLLNHLLKLGARRHALEAKVFGGGQVMASLTRSQVGEKNAEFVLNYLKLESIPVVARDLLDVYPRKVYFFPANGRVMQKKLVTMHNDTVAERESEYARRLNRDSIEGDVELFG